MHTYQQELAKLREATKVLAELVTLVFCLSYLLALPLAVGFSKVSSLQPVLHDPSWPERLGFGLMLIGTGGLLSSELRTALENTGPLKIAAMLTGLPMLLTVAEHCF